MALPAVAGQTIAATDMYQLCQPSGAQEIGYYYLNNWGSAGGDQFGYGVQSQSHVSTPVSVTLDTSVQAASGVNSPGTGNLTSTGFHVFTTTSAATTGGAVAGKYTIQY